VPATPTLTAASLGAWLLKANPAGGAVEKLVRRGFEDVTTRCVRSSYRTALVAEGQPVLLWVSGRDPLHPPGLHAAGWTTGPVVGSDDGPVMPVRLLPLAPIVPREALVEHPLLSHLEVLRMPAGSNPSYLDVTQYAELRVAFPQVDRADGPGAGSA
jgi:hypothetical protein